MNFNTKILTVTIFFIIPIFFPLSSISQQYQKRIILVPDSIHSGRIGTALFYGDTLTAPIAKRIVYSSHIGLSSDSLLACVSKPKNHNDSLSIIEIYNYKGEILNTFNGPNVFKIRIANDGRVALCGSFPTQNILPPEFLYLFDKNGIFIKQADYTFGPIINATYSNTGKYFAFLACKYFGRVPQLEYKLIVYNDINEKLFELDFNLNQTARNLRMESIDESNGTIELKRSSKDTSGYKVEYLTVNITSKMQEGEWREK